ncbi:hypothetical protein EVAR_95075_1 [Eumeta japonica]|uniref:Uncharacterized protein n=1 Tax=Eumeta variegata TaxID=151549 RepID=A0A4C1W6H1_EUMVA|nr:hypothetical protein EVAR_95075_1 [Eumeta japonica]
MNSKDLMIRWAGSGQGGRGRAAACALCKNSLGVSGPEKLAVTYRFPFVSCYGTVEAEPRLPLRPDLLSACGSVRVGFGLRLFKLLPALNFSG